MNKTIHMYSGEKQQRERGCVGVGGGEEEGRRGKRGKEGGRGVGGGGEGGGGNTARST